MAVSPTLILSTTSSMFFCKIMTYFWVPIEYHWSIHRRQVTCMCNNKRQIGWLYPEPTPKYNPFDLYNILRLILYLKVPLHILRHFAEATMCYEKSNNGIWKHINVWKAKFNGQITIYKVRVLDPLWILNPVRFLGLQLLFILCTFSTYGRSKPYATYSLAQP